MGNLISKYTSPKGSSASKKLVKPRNLQSLADSVALPLIQGETLETSLESSPWASAFSAYLDRKDRETGCHSNQELTIMFHFFIYCSALKIALREHPDRVEILLDDIRDQFFMDSRDTAKPLQEMKAAVKVDDPERKVSDIFRLFRSRVMNSFTAQDRQRLERQIISLRQDEDISDKLDGEAYTDFMSRPPCVCQCPFHCPTSQKPQKEQSKDQMKYRATCNIVLSSPTESSQAKQHTLL